MTFGNLVNRLLLWKIHWTRGSTVFLNWRGHPSMHFRWWNPFCGHYSIFCWSSQSFAYLCDLTYSTAESSELAYKYMETISCGEAAVSLSENEDSVFFGLKMAKFDVLSWSMLKYYDSVPTHSILSRSLFKSPFFEIYSKFQYERLIF